MNKLDYTVKIVFCFIKLFAFIYLFCVSFSQLCIHNLQIYLFILAPMFSSILLIFVNHIWLDDPGLDALFVACTEGMDNVCL
jgi:hypothetical protein